MPNSPGTIETLALQMGKLLRPLEDLLGPSFFMQLGVELPREISGDPTLLSQLSAAGTAAGALDSEIASLSTAISSNDTGSMISASASLIASVGKLISALVQAADALQQAANGLNATDKATLQDFANVMAERVLEYMVVGYLDEQMPTLTSVLTVLGLIDKEYRAAPTLEVSHAPFDVIPRRFYFSNLIQLLSGPDKYFQQTFKWGANDFDGVALLQKLQAMLEDLGVPATIYTTTGQPPILEAFIFSIQADSSILPPGLTFELSLPGTDTFDQVINFSTLWQGTTHVAANYPPGVSASLRPPFELNVQPPSGSFDLDLALGVQAGGKETDPIIILGVTGGSRLQATSIGGSVGVNASFGTGGGSLRPAIEFQIKGGKLYIDLSDADGFLSSIAGGANIEAGFDLSILWQPDSGIHIQGAADLEIALRVHLNLGPIDLPTIYIAGKVDSGGLTLELSADIGASLGPLQASVNRLGLLANFQFPPGGGNLGPLDLNLGFKSPTGVGLSIDAGIVTGGGFLNIDTEHGEYDGILQLMIADFVSVTAIGLITTKMPDGSSGFSLLIIITADFGAGFQLGFGFTLLAVGGLLGVNRSMLFQPLMDAVRSDAIESIMFPQNVIANATRIISDLRAIFPPQDGTFLIGPMAKIGWGEPTLVSLALGIIIEIPPGDIAILGVLKLALPADEVAVILLQVNFAGALEIDKKRFYFYAVLYDSHILFITLEGSMGVLFAWGDDANFVVSIGGFHPQFKPPPLPFPALTRIQINIINESFARIRADGYFAVTTNTVQFGAHSEYYFGFDALNIQGHSGFDALIQFSPFHFIVSIETDFSVELFGLGLYGIGMSLTVEGPSPWHIHGSASLSFLFFSIDIPVDITFGDEPNTMLPPVAVIPILAAEYAKASNWRAVLPAGNNPLVSLRQLDASEADMILDPGGTLNISQRAIPLDLTLDKVGHQQPSDANRFTLTVASAGLNVVKELQEQFAAAQYMNMSDAAKLSQQAYSPLDSGLELSSAGNFYTSGTALVRNVRYDLTVLDINLRPVKRRFYRLAGSLFNHFLAGASVARNPLSAYVATQMQPAREKVAVNPESFAVANVADNTVFHPQAAAFTSQLSANDYLNRAVAKDPSLVGSIHVIPQFEVAA